VELLYSNLASGPPGQSFDWSADRSDYADGSFTVTAPDPGNEYLESRRWAPRLGVNWTLEPADLPSRLEGVEPRGAIHVPPLDQLLPLDGESPRRSLESGKLRQQLVIGAYSSSSGADARAALSLPALAIAERRVPRPCVRDEIAHCLGDRGFEVTVDWRTEDGATGSARRVDLTDDSGLFYFFAPDNLELIAKVLDACDSAFDSHWVFTAGLTDVEYVMEVVEGESGRRRHYENRQKRAARSELDTSAFKPCPAPLEAGLDAPMADPIPATRAASRSAGRSTGACMPGPTTLCLAGGRFQVETEWRTSGGAAGDGTSIPLTGDTGAFWFFNAENVEILVKVLDACSSQFDSFWVFAAGLTNVEVRLTITDTETGSVKIYDNPLDRTFRPIQDTAAFATCP
jgi:hypothetical protein